MKRKPKGLPNRTAVQLLPEHEAEMARLAAAQPHHPDANTERPLLLSDVAKHHDPKCRWPCSNGLVVVHSKPSDHGHVGICGCAQRRFLAAHGAHVIKSKGQQFWRKSWVPSQQPVPVAEMVKEVTQ